MSTIKSSTEHLTLNADGAGKEIKFQANGVEKASISSAGAFTSTSIDATKLSGALPAIDGSALTGNVGKVLQVVSDTNGTAITTTSNTNVLIASVTITVSGGSTVVLEGTVPHYSDATGSWDSTFALFLYDSSAVIQSTEHYGQMSVANGAMQGAISHVTGVKTAGTYTYYMYSRSTTGTATHYYNRAPRKSVLIATEIGA
jgi:hypothetical protein